MKEYEMNQLIKGLEKGFTKNCEKMARKYMKENGYKLTIYGKNQALADLDCADEILVRYSTDFVIALKIAIALLPVVGEDGYDY